MDATPWMRWSNYRNGVLGNSDYWSRTSPFSINVRRTVGAVELFRNIITIHHAAVPRLCCASGRVTEWVLCLARVQLVTMPSTVTHLWGIFRLSHTHISGDINLQPPSTDLLAQWRPGQRNNNNIQGTQGTSEYNRVHQGTARSIYCDLLNLLNQSCKGNYKSSSVEESMRNRGGPQWISVWYLHTMLHGTFDAMSLQIREMHHRAGYIRIKKRDSRL